MQENVAIAGRNADATAELEQSSTLMEQRVRRIFCAHSLSCAELVPRCYCPLLAALLFALIW